MVLSQLAGRVSDALGDRPPGATAGQAGTTPGKSADRGAPNTAPSVDLDRPLNVCLLSYRSDPYSGGQGVYVKYLSRALTRLGHEVTVVSGAPYPELPAAVDLVELPGENIIEAENRVRTFEPEYLREPAKLFEWASVLTGGFPEPYTFGRRAADYLAANGDRYDVVHDNQSLCHGLCDIARQLPTVATIHHPITADREIDLAHADGVVERLLVRRWYRFLAMQAEVASDLSHLITVSRATKQRTVADFGVDPDTIDVVHNGIDTDLFRPRPDVRTEPRRIMTTVSADVPLKGTTYLLEAFAGVRDRFPEAELVVVGAFDDDGTAARRVEALGIGDAVHTHAEISYERMVELYGSAAVAAVPSLYEGFGLPAAEAMACGVPPVATTGGALPEVVGDAGRLVEPADADALAGGLCDLLDDDDARQRLGERARERVLDRFDWEHTAAATVETYREAIRAHG